MGALGVTNGFTGGKVTFHKPDLFTNRASPDSKLILDGKPLLNFNAREY